MRNTPITCQNRPDRYTQHISPQGLVTVTKYGSDPCTKPARTKKISPASRDGPADWALIPADEPGRSGGYGTWTLMGL
jgi:hypothetical protein